MPPFVGYLLGPSPGDRFTSERFDLFKPAVSSSWCPRILWEGLFSPPPRAPVHFVCRRSEAGGGNGSELYPEHIIFGLANRMCFNLLLFSAAPLKKDNLGHPPCKSHCRKSTDSLPFGCPCSAQEGSQPPVANSTVLVHVYLEARRIEFNGTCS